MAKYKLGEICDIVSGSTPKTGIPEYWDGDLKWITPAEISDDSYVITDSVRKLTELGVKKTGLSPLPVGTVILSSRAPIGKIAIAGCEMYCNQGFKNLICSDKINNRYLYWFLKGNTAFLNSLGRGATFKEVSKQIVASIEINVPSLEQQLQAVENLECVSSIIQLRQRQLQKLDELVKARFIELFGDPVDNDRMWPTETLNSVCSTIVDCPHSTPSYTSDNTGYMCIRTSIVKKNHIVWDEIEYISEQEYFLRIQRKRPERGDVIYTREGAILGIAAMIDRECNVALGQRSMLLSPDTYKCLPQFLSAAMNFDSFLRKALGGVSGSASPHINVGDIKAFAIILPPIELQEQFVSFVEQVDKSKVAVQKALDEAQLLFDSLMQKYFGSRNEI